MVWQFMATGPRAESAFVDLRRLADWFAAVGSHPTISIERIVRRLGTRCVPLLGRELGSPDPGRRGAAREALALLAKTDDTRARVLEELRAVASGVGSDDGKVCALGLLADHMAEMDIEF